jgi:pyruvate/2-oxoglutarate dehydrogenase complex dihydrolipoamide dehydrogenase (E3) component
MKTSSTETSEFDFVIIGGGSAGYAAARTAASFGLKTAVVDGAEVLGGLCILRGCMPSKALIESADRNLTIRHATGFGLRAQAGAPDMKAIRDRKRRLIGEFAQYRQNQLGDGRFTLIRARAHFSDAHSLRVTPREGTAHEVRFRYACIATGSKVSLPDVPGLEQTGYWTSDDVLDAATLPSSFIVLGGGAIALEMAHYLEGLGRTVTLIQRSSRLLSTMDEECGSTVRQAFEQRGIQVHTGTQLKSAVVSGDGKKRLTFTQGEQTVTVSAEEILVATGRSAATGDLALSAAGIESEKGKITVNSHMQTTQPHIFAAGDVVASLDVVHIAIQQGEIAARNASALAKGAVPSQSYDDRLELMGVFCEPQIGTVGAGEAALKAAGIPYLAASYPFNDHGKSIIMGVEHGFVKMLCHAVTGEILGASVVGPEATELIHEIVVAMNWRATVQQFMSIPHYHPTLSEIWTYPAEELAEQLAPQAHEY